MSDDLGWWWWRLVYRLFCVCVSQCLCVCMILDGKSTKKSHPQSAQDPVHSNSLEEAKLPSCLSVQALWIVPSSGQCLVWRDCGPAYSADVFPGEEGVCPSEREENWGYWFVSSQGTFAVHFHEFWIWSVPEHSRPFLCLKMGAVLCSVLWCFMCSALSCVVFCFMMRYNPLFHPKADIFHLTCCVSTVVLTWARSFVGL